MTKATSHLEPFNIPGGARCQQIVIRPVGSGEQLSRVCIPSSINPRGPHGHIEDVLTNPAFRSQGHATRAINEAIAFAREHEYYKLLLTCQPRLIGFYKEFGFRLMAENPAGYEDWLLNENPFGVREATMRQNFDE